jgi:hypothetical protein
VISITPTCTNEGLADFQGLVGDETVDLAPQVAKGPRRALLLRELLQRLTPALDLAAGLGGS